jgi:hypothetical protein
VGTNLERADLSPYVNTLCELVLNQDLNSRAFIPHPYEEMIYNALSQIFNYGLSWYDFFGPPAAGSRKQISEAFDYFNKHTRKNAIKTNFEQAKNKIKNGIHPSMLIRNRIIFVKVFQKRSSMSCRT